METTVLGKNYNMRLKMIRCPTVTVDILVWSFTTVNGVQAFGAFAALETLLMPSL